MKSESNITQNKATKYHGIAISRVINSEYLDSLRDIYKCNICFKIMINPTDCEKCGHSYCFDCINDFRCPFSCENSNIRPSSVGIKLILNNLNFRCDNDGCEENILYSNLINHDFHCEYKLIKCPNLNCGINLAKKNLQNHIENECKYTIERCRYCGYEFPRGEVKNHVESCETIFHSLNLSANEDFNIAHNNSQDSISLNNTHNFNQSHLIGKKDFSKIKAKSYLEALNINLSKIVRENDEKYKALKEENTKMKTEYNSEVKDLLAKLNEKISSLKKNDDDSESEKDYSENDLDHHIDDKAKLPTSENYLNDKCEVNNLDKQRVEAFCMLNNVYSGEENSKINEIQLLKDLNGTEVETINRKEKKNIQLNQSLVIEKKNQQQSPQNNLNQPVLVKAGNFKKIESKALKLFMASIKEVMQKQINDILLTNMSNSLKSQLNDQEEKLKEIFIIESMKENVKFNEEIVKIIKQIIKLSEENIKSFLKDIKSYIIEEFKIQMKANNDGKQNKNDDTENISNILNKNLNEMNLEIISSIKLNTDTVDENFSNLNLNFMELNNKIEQILINSRDNRSFSKDNSEKDNQNTLKIVNEIEALLTSDRIKSENLELMKINNKEIEKFIKNVLEESMKNIVLENMLVKEKLVAEETAFQDDLLNSINEKIEEKNISISNCFQEALLKIKSMMQNQLEDYKENFKGVKEKNNEISDKLDKLQNDKFNLKQGDTSNSEIENNAIDQDMLNLKIEKLTSSFLKNVIETFHDKIEEVKIFIDESITKNIKGINVQSLPEESVDNQNKIETIPKEYFSEFELKLESIIKKFEANVSEEFDVLKTDFAVFSKNNKEIKSIFNEEFGEIAKVLHKLTDENKLRGAEELSINEKKKENLELERDNFNKLIDQLLDKKIDIIYEKITKNIFTNIQSENEQLHFKLCSKIQDSNQQFLNYSSKKDGEYQDKIKIINDNIEKVNTQLEKLDCLNDKVEDLQEGFNDEINNFAQNTQKTLSFNQMDLIIKLKESFEDINLTNINKIIEQEKEKEKVNLIREENQDTKNLQTIEEILAKHDNKIKHEISEVIEIKLEKQFKSIDSKIEEKISKKLEEFYALKWCISCEKVEHNFSFTDCKICSKQNCKDCTKLCKACKSLSCKKCVMCPKCNDFSCLNCRTDCIFCSVEKQQKFCKECIKTCFYCKKSSCTDCVRQCLNCSSLSCRECARLCRICLKCSCRRCETVKNFKSCCHCMQTACTECVVECDQCKFEICNNCFNCCKNCNKILCKKCGVDCENCGDIFCEKCAKDLNQNNCYLCKKLFCISCVKFLRKCKKCSGSACKNCCANCLKCKNVFCKNCNVNCDSCEDYACVLCVYKCSCEKLIFCEKCLFGISPISPELHNCVLWLNDSPIFTGMKSRSKAVLPKNFEAKLYLEKFEMTNFLIGITDNSTFSEDTITFIDNIWAFKPQTGQKYSSKKSLEPYLNKEAREKDFIIIAIKNDNLYFRVNFDDNPPAYQLPVNKDYYLYVENDSMLSNLRVKFVYLRKI